jgi:hypothetical protein
MFEKKRLGTRLLKASGRKSYDLLIVLKRITFEDWSETNVTNDS